MNQMAMSFVQTRARSTDCDIVEQRRSRFSAGMKFHFFTLLTPSVDKHGREQWLARCDCGTEKIVRARSVESGHTKSCGCYQKKMRSALLVRHGHAIRGKSITYTSWQAMVHRCTSVGSKSYPRYGGAGISVCKEWLCFDVFLADMGERPKGTSIDRIDGSKGYSPANCRWATPGVQASNTTRAKLTPETAVELYRLKGSITGRAAAIEFGVSHHTVFAVWSGKAWKDFTQRAAA